MRLHAEQLATWERQDLQSWMIRTFPDRTHGLSRADITAYLDDRIAHANALRFTSSTHLRYLIGYELGCGVPWMLATEPAAPAHTTVWASLLAALRPADVDPDARIAAAERLLYGDADD